MHISWARLASFCHLGFISDPLIVSKFHNETAVDAASSKNGCGNCTKIANFFFFHFSSEMLVVKAGIHKMLFRKANREDPDQTAS